MIEDDDDRALFFDEDGFAIEVSVRPAGTGVFEPFTLSGIYDAPPGEHRAVFRHGAPLAGSKPKFRCLASEMPKSLAGRSVATISGVDYTLFKIEHDGTGMAFVEVKLV